MMSKMLCSLASLSTSVRICTRRMGMVVAMLIMVTMFHSLRVRKWTRFKWIEGKTKDKIDFR